MQNRIKIFNNNEFGKLNFFLMNDDGAWMAVPVESELSRGEYTSLSINDDARKILDYINETYCLGEEIDLVLENFSDELVSFMKVAEEFKNIKVFSNSFGVLVIGREGTGKSTLIDAFGARKSVEVFENYECYTSSGIEWNEVRGLSITQGTYSAIEAAIKEITETRSVSVIIYCVSSKNGRIEDAEIEAINYARTCSPNARSIIVVTNSIDDVASARLIDEINKLVMDIPCISVLAKDEEIKLGTIEAFGIDKLKRYIFEGIV